MPNSEKKQEKILENNYHMMPNEAECLDPYEYRVLGHIIRRCGPNYGGECWESQSHAAASCSISRKKYNEVIEDLRDKNIIKVEKRPGKNHDITWNHPSIWKIEGFNYKKPNHSIEPVTGSVTPDEPVTLSYNPCNSQLQPPVTLSYNPCNSQLQPSMLVEEEPIKKNQIEEDVSKKSDTQSLACPDSDVLDFEDIESNSPTVMASLWHRRLLENQPNASFDYYSQEQAIIKLQRLGFTNEDIFKVFLYQQEQAQKKFPRTWLPTDLTKECKDGTQRFIYVLQECESDKGFINKWKYAISKTKKGTTTGQSSVPF